MAALAHRHHATMDPPNEPGALPNVHANRMVVSPDRGRKGDVRGNCDPVLRAVGFSILLRIL
jgi:hypothetical protein